MIHIFGYNACEHVREACSIGGVHLFAPGNFRVFPSEGGTGTSEFYDRGIIIARFRQNVFSNDGGIFTQNRRNARSCFEK